MLRIKVFQHGVNRIYVTKSFNRRFNDKSETYNFMYEMVEIDKGDKKMISFEDAITKTYVFVSPLTCLIEFEEVADE